MFKTRFNIRMVETPAEGGDPDPKPNEEPKTETPKTEDKPKERTYSQSELDGILARKLAEQSELKAKAKSAEESFEEAAQRKYEEGLRAGRIEATKKVISQKYGLDVSALPDDEDALTKLESGINAYATGHMKVVPAVNPDAKSKLPSFVTGVA